MSQFIEIHTTTNTEEEAHKIAHALVERRLAACAQVSPPVASVYHWQGNIEEGQEWQCSLKARADLLDQVAAAIREHHSYECPQIVALPLAHVSADYEAWLKSELR